MSDNNEINGIDEGLYSRQLYVFGHGSMSKITNAKVLLIGVSGVGVEVAKNLILSGIGQLDIFDNHFVSQKDIDTNFYVSETDVGKPIKKVVLNKLSELNSNVKVSFVDDLEANLNGYTTIVVTDSLLSSVNKLNGYTHANNIPFVSCTSTGLFGSIFCDFGENYVVEDVDGEAPKHLPIVTLKRSSNSNSELSYVLETATVHDLSDGNQFVLVNTKSNVTSDVFTVSKTEKQTLIHFKTSTELNVDLFNSYGEFRSIKTPSKMSFRSLEASYEDNPDFMYIDFAHFDRPKTIHLAHRLLNDFYNKHNRYPTPFNEDDFKDFCGQSLTDGFEIDVLRHFCNQCDTRNVAVNSVIGSIVAQEVIKAVTKKYTPIKQYMYFESLDSMPEKVDPSDCGRVNARYDTSRVIFGNNWVNTIQNLKTFIVGSGAIGCELLKNFAMMGISTGLEGELTITDMDTIEKSNLSRQFLFRPDDIGKMKSDSAAKRSRIMNPHLKIVSHTNKVAKDTENVYTRKFWESQDVIVNALDNIDARKYVDSKCVEFGKPLLESGTLGTKGNVQVIVPNITESYGSSNDPPENSIPVCTLKHYPSTIDHTIQWSRDFFESLFVKPVEDVNKFLSGDLNVPQNEIPEFYHNVNNYGVLKVPTNIYDCVRIGYGHWKQNFVDNINALLKEHPLDSTTTEGAPFWSGTKRCPVPLQFGTNKYNIDFLKYFAYLYAGLYTSSGITPVVLTDTEILNIVTEIEASNSNDNKMAVDEKKEEISTEQYLELLKGLHVLSDKLTPQSFEKDDDSNHHIDFITSMSNLRAMNYSIECADKHKTKGIAGKIIPAIATTTSLVAGLVSLELYKLIFGHTNVDLFRNAFVNLALPMIAFSSPVEAPMLETNGIKYNLWTFVDYDHNITLKELIDNLNTNFNVEINAVMYGSGMLYCPFMAGYGATTLDTDIATILRSRNVYCKPGESVTLVVTASRNITNEDGEEEEEDVDIPPIRINF